MESKPTKYFILGVIFFLLFFVLLPGNLFKLHSKNEYTKYFIHAFVFSILITFICSNFLNENIKEGQIRGYTCSSSALIKNLNQDIHTQAAINGRSDGKLKFASLRGLRLSNFVYCLGETSTNSGITSDNEINSLVDALNTLVRRIDISTNPTPEEVGIIKTFCNSSQWTNNIARERIQDTSYNEFCIRWSNYIPDSTSSTSSSTSSASPSTSTSSTSSSTSPSTSTSSSTSSSVTPPQTQTTTTAFWIGVSNERIGPETVNPDGNGLIITDFRNMAGDSIAQLYKKSEIFRLYSYMFEGIVYDTVRARQYDNDNNKLYPSWSVKNSSVGFNNAATKIMAQESFKISMSVIKNLFKTTQLYPDQNIVKSIAILDYAYVNGSPSDQQIFIYNLTNTIRNLPPLASSEYATSQLAYCNISNYPNDFDKFNNTPYQLIIENIKSNDNVGGFFSNNTLLPFNGFDMSNNICIHCDAGKVYDNTDGTCITIPVSTKTASISDVDTGGKKPLLSPPRLSAFSSSSSLSPSSSSSDSLSSLPPPAPQMPVVCSTNDSINNPSRGIEPADCRTCFAGCLQSNYQPLHTNYNQAMCDPDGIEKMCMRQDNQGKLTYDPTLTRWVNSAGHVDVSCGDPVFQAAYIKCSTYCNSNVFYVDYNTSEKLLGPAVPEAPTVSREAQANYDQCMRSNPRNPRMCASINPSTNQSDARIVARDVPYFITHQLRCNGDLIAQYKNVKGLLHVSDKCSGVDNLNSSGVVIWPGGVGMRNNNHMGMPIFNPSTVSGSGQAPYGCYSGDANLYKLADVESHNRLVDSEMFIVTTLIGAALGPMGLDPIAPMLSGLKMGAGVVAKALIPQAIRDAAQAAVSRAATYTGTIIERAAGFVSRNGRSEIADIAEEAGTLDHIYPNAAPSESGLTRVSTRIEATQADTTGESTTDSFFDRCPV